MEKYCSPWYAIATVLCAIVRPFRAKLDAEGFKRSFQGTNSMYNAFEFVIR